MISLECFTKQRQNKLDLAISLVNISICRIVYGSRDATIEYKNVIRNSRQTHNSNPLIPSDLATAKIDYTWNLAYLHRRLGFLQCICESIHRSLEGHTNSICEINGIPSRSKCIMRRLQLKKIRTHMCKIIKTRMKATDVFPNSNKAFRCNVKRS